MPNSRHKEGAPRIVVDQHGVQRLAFSDGTPVPVIISTSVVQDCDMARAGTANVACELYVKADGYVFPDGAASITDNVLTLGGKSIVLDHCTVVLPKSADESAIAYISCTAYLDPTIPDA